MKAIKEKILNKFIIYDFYNFSVLKRFSPPFFKTTHNITTNSPILFEQNPNSFNQKNILYYITYIPNYVKTTTNNSLKHLSLYQFKGFLINIKEFDSLESYMSKQFGSKSRGKIRSYYRRLDSCFNTRYKLYYGEIEKNNYHFLMEVLDKMITRRFDQRGDEHQAKKNWDYYKETTYQYIIDKKASLFVIYDNDKPIDICLNYHYDNIMINYIRAFDIDYSKFRLGSIDILKQLEWCFENKYEIFDLGGGVFSYKKQWCNVSYKFRNDVVFNKKSVKNTFLGYFIFILLKLKLYLNKKNILRDKANSSRDVSDNNNNNNNNIKTDKISYEFKLTEYKKNEIVNNLIQIDIEQDAYKFLRKPVYDYLYLNFDNKNAVVIYKLKNKPDSYFLKGKKKYGVECKK